MDNQILAHTKHNCMYYIIFIPKYRWKVMYGKIGKEAGEILSAVCNLQGYICQAPQVKKILPIGRTEKEAAQTPPIGGTEKCPGGAYPDHRQSRWSSRMAVILERTKMSLTRGTI